jgi:aspartyl-tRNA(Asn)/glutamyl-tRNA(Gln) amidotransferase subunit A
MTPEDIGFAPATDLVRAIRRKALSPVEVVRAVLDRIAAVNPRINAYCLVTAESALAEARAAEQAVVRGEPLPPLHGVPLSVKDMVLTRGLRTMMGSRIHEHRVPDEDAPMVTRLKAAGAIVVGKTTTPEFGWKALTDSPVTGLSRNPWALDRNPGGSSGGAAAAAAAGLGPLHTGGDGAGSIRIPASFCGVFGFKPSFGRVPAYPATGPQLAHLGPITRTVPDAALMLSAMAGPDPRDQFSLEAPPADYRARLRGGVAGWRIAWSPDLGFAEQVDPEVRELAAGAARAFEALGAAVEDVRIDWGDPFPIIRTLWRASYAAMLRPHLPRFEAEVDPGLLACAREGMDMRAEELLRAHADRQAFYDRVQAFFRQYDLLLTPTVAALPLRLGRLAPESYADHPWDWIRWAPFSFPFNLTHLPAATVPAGFSREGLPVGLQLVGARLADVRVLRAAAAYEQARPWRKARPPLAPAGDVGPARPR